MIELVKHYNINMADKLTNEQLMAKLRPKLLTKQIKGQRIIMGRRTSNRSSETFTYGQIEDVWPMTFQFILRIGGYSGAPEQHPPEGYEWIKHFKDDDERYQVKKSDLEGNYREKDDQT